MKKKTVLIVMILGLICCLCSCSSTADLNGTWISNAGNVMLKFDNGNIGVSAYSDENMVSEQYGTYSVDGDVINVTYDNGETDQLTFSINNGVLKIKIDGKEPATSLKKSDVAFEDILNSAKAPQTDTSADGIPVDYNNAAKETTLSTGNFQVGVDVSPGRYKITANEGLGFFNIVSSAGAQTSFLLASALDDSSLEVYLYDGERVTIDGMESVSLVPKAPSLRTSLGSGIFIVGLDIEAGTYNISAKNQTGNISIDSPNSSSLKINEAFGGESGVDNVNAPLVDGDIITIMNMSNVNFKEATK